MTYVRGMAAERSKLCIRGSIFQMQYYYISHGLRSRNGRGAVNALFSRVNLPDEVLLDIAWLTFGEWPRSGQSFVFAGLFSGCSTIIYRMAYVRGMAAERSMLCIRGSIFRMQYYYISHGLRSGNGRGAVIAL